MNMCEKEGNKRDYNALRNFIEQSNLYREDLVRLLNLDFNNPSKDLKEFAEKAKLDLKRQDVQDNFIKIRKELIDKINKFYENNFLKNDPSAIDERKQVAKEIKDLKKKQKDGKEGVKEKDKNLQENSKTNNSEITNNKVKEKPKNKTSFANQLIFFSTIILVISILLYVILYT